MTNKLVKIIMGIFIFPSIMHAPAKVKFTLPDDSENASAATATSSSQGAIATFSSAASLAAPARGPIVSFDKNNLPINQTIYEQIREKFNLYASANLITLSIVLLGCSAVSFIAIPEFSRIYEQFYAMEMFYKSPSMAIGIILGISLGFLGMNLPTICNSFYNHETKTDSLSEVGVSSSQSPSQSQSDGSSETMVDSQSQSPSQSTSSIISSYSSSASAAAASITSTGFSSRAQDVSGNSSSEFIGSAYYEMHKNFKANGRIWMAFEKWVIRHRVFEYLLTSLKCSDPSFRICSNISCVYGATFRENLKHIYGNANHELVVNRVVDQVFENKNTPESFKPHINDIIALSFLPIFQTISARSDYHDNHSIFATILKLKRLIAKFSDDEIESYIASKMNKKIDKKLARNFALQMNQENDKTIKNLLIDLIQAKGDVYNTLAESKNIFLQVLFFNMWIQFDIREWDNYYTHLCDFISQPNLFEKFDFIRKISDRVNNKNLIRAVVKDLDSQIPSLFGYLQPCAPFVQNELFSLFLSRNKFNDEKLFALADECSDPGARILCLSHMKEIKKEYLDYDLGRTTLQALFSIAFDKNSEKEVYSMLEYFFNKVMNMELESNEKGISSRKNVFDFLDIAYNLCNYARVKYDKKELAKRVLEFTYQFYRKLPKGRLERAHLTGLFLRLDALMAIDSFDYFDISELKKKIERVFSFCIGEEKMFFDEILSHFSLDIALPNIKNLFLNPSFEWDKMGDESIGKKFHQLYLASKKS